MPSFLLRASSVLFFQSCNAPSFPPNTLWPPKKFVKQPRFEHLSLALRLHFQCQAELALRHLTFTLAVQGRRMGQLLPGVWGQRGLPRAAGQGLRRPIPSCQPGAGQMGSTRADPVLGRTPTRGRAEAKQRCQPMGRGQDQAQWGGPGSDTTPGYPGGAFTGELGLVMLTQQLVTDTCTVVVYRIFWTKGFPHTWKLFLWVFPRNLSSLTD